MFPGFRLVAGAFILSSSMFLACSTNPTGPVPVPAPVVPVADTPAHAVDRFRWAMENRSFETYRTLFTDDFVFAFAALDTSGNAWRNDPWTRENELLSFQHLAVGGGRSAPASLVTLILDRRLTVVPDPRPGKDPVTNQHVVSQCNLTVQTSEGRAYNISGKLGLFLVRGDAAVLPADLGHAPDSTRWYIERWEDQTFAPTALSVPGTSQLMAAQPSQNYSWGSLKALYLPSAPALASGLRP